MTHENADWPDAETFIDPTGAETHADGTVRCIGLTVCDHAGTPTRSFPQGGTARVFCEFEVLSPLEEAIACGLEVRDVSDRVIHGKNSFQTGQTPTGAPAGSRLRFMFALPLELEPGDYRVTVGVASAPADEYQQYRLGAIGHLAFRTQERCRVVDVCTLTVRLQDSGTLTHHGLVNLPSRCDVALVSPPENRAPAVPREPVGAPAVEEAPTIVHVTHWKAGSQWIKRIFSACVPDRVVAPQVGDVQFLLRPIRPGMVYPTIYATRAQYDRVRVPDDTRRFVVIRDLRDTLVSAYFSISISHRVEEESLARLRTVLQTLDREAGLLHLIREWLPFCAEIQQSWLEAGEPLIRYEDLLESDEAILEPLLIDRCGLPVPRERLREAIRASRFSAITGRRERGEEDVTAHERKGVAGDWRNHFTPRLKDAFAIRYGGLLVATGYERDLNW
ncbi:MAG: Wzt carbohydrate-binding domain-containing protein [Vicinamibacterales bacterium]